MKKDTDLQPPKGRSRPARDTMVGIRGPVAPKQSAIDPRWQRLLKGNPDQELSNRYKRLLGHRGKRG